MIIDSFENKQKILDNFLKIVAFEDWSKETLILICELLGEYYSLHGRDNEWQILETK